MMNIGNMMRQAQEMQAKMAQLQERLGLMEVAGQAGGGAVTVVQTGKGEMRKIALDPALLNPAEKEVLEDLIVAACNDARAKAEAETARETEKLMGGLKLPPGIKLPF